MSNLNLKKEKSANGLIIISCLFFLNKLIFKFVKILYGNNFFVESILHFLLEAVSERHATSITHLFWFFRVTKKSDLNGYTRFCRNRILFMYSYFFLTKTYKYPPNPGNTLKKNLSKAVKTLTTAALSLNLKKNPRGIKKEVIESTTRILFFVANSI